MRHELNQEQLLMHDSIKQQVIKIQQDPALNFKEKWKAIAQTGIISIAVDSSLGGLGLGAFDQLVAFEALGRASSDNGFNFALAAHTLACVIPISKYASAEQASTILPRLLDGTSICANAMTESESGSSVYQLQTKAQLQNENQYILNGAKTFISNGAIADYCLVYAETSANKGFFGGISAFLIDKDQYNCVQSYRKMGLESVDLSELHFNQSVIDISCLLSKAGGGGFIFNQSMEWERTCLAGLHIGAMERVMEQVIEFAKSRKSNGLSISKYQAISHRIAEMQVLIDTSKTLAYSTARMLDKKLNVSRESSTTKLYVSEAVAKFMLEALSVFGASGYIKEFGIEQEVRDALAASIYSGTNDIQKNIISSNLGL